MLRAKGVDDGLGKTPHRTVREDPLNERTLSNCTTLPGKKRYPPKPTVLYRAFLVPPGRLRDDANNNTRKPEPGRIPPGGGRPSDAHGGIVKELLGMNGENSDTDYDGEAGCGTEGCGMRMDH